MADSIETGGSVAAHVERLIYFLEFKVLMAVTRRQRDHFANISSGSTLDWVTTFAIQISEWKREH